MMSRPKPSETVGNYTSSSVGSMQTGSGGTVRKFLEFAFGEHSRSIPRHDIHLVAGTKISQERLQALGESVFAEVDALVPARIELLLSTKRPYNSNSFEPSWIGALASRKNKFTLEELADSTSYGNPYHFISGNTQQQISQYCAAIDGQDPKAIREAARDLLVTVQSFAVLLLGHGFRIK